MRDKFVLRLLGLLETTQYTLEQSHGVPPVSVACDHTTLMEEDACGYSSIKIVRSIDLYESQKYNPLKLKCLSAFRESLSDHRSDDASLARPWQKRRWWARFALGCLLICALGRADAHQASRFALDGSLLGRECGGARLYWASARCPSPDPRSLQ